MAGTSLSEHWQPTNDDREYGHRILHLTDSQIDDMAEDMRLWAGANANRQIARKSNWSMAFKGWMRRKAKQQGATNGHRNGSAGAAAGRLAAAAERGEFSIAPRPSLLPKTGGMDVRLLPPGRSERS
jgi:hypothetical protein